ncbi:penicillin-binding transpeptidase domain-containing protein [Salicibibacter kimchii]|nr:penicillin-binding transpeptidase domain-containing protein [Salicibibacter kimchii]
MQNKVHIFVCMLFILALGACSGGPQPKAAFETYASDWENENFENMYEQLSTETLENVSPEDFVDRYEDVYENIQRSDLTVQPNYPEEWDVGEEGEVQFPVDVTMQTRAGEVSFSHDVQLSLEERDDEENWYVHWDQQLIFPEMEEGDHIGVTTMEAERGEIYDRNENGLAINGTVLQVGMVPERMEGEEEQSIEDFAEELDISEEDIEMQLEQEWVNPDSFVPLYTMPEDEQDYIEDELMENIPGITFQPEDSRVYPYAGSAAHLVGYVREITAEELEELEEEGYGSHDLLGVTGLESLLEDELKGETGEEIYTYEENAEEPKETIVEKEPIDGEDLHLTIDIELQENIFEELDGDSGTATAVHPTTGEVLAMVNAPAYDPNIYVAGQSAEVHAEWQEDPDQPLLNRFQYTFSPGSTFKHMTAATALDSETITPDEDFDIEGLDWQKDESWGDYEVTRVKDPEEPVDLRDALVFSDNIFFAQTALEMGGDTFEEGIKNFGFGEDIPFTYPIEKSSTLAEGDTFENDVMLADSSYGQGEVQMSPLHLSMTYTPFLNEGDMLTPVLLKEEADEVEVWNDDVMEAETADTILQSLIKVVEESDGTGHEAEVSGQTLAGKTGTAELKENPDDDNDQLGWFVAFDTDEADLLVTMMVEDVQEHGGSGYVVPKVGNIMEEYQP